MASSTLAPYLSSTTTKSFSLASQGADLVLWRDPTTSRSLARPYTVSLIRKIGPQNAKGNDHVTLKISRTESNAATGQPVTAYCSLDISIPRDTSCIAAGNVQELVALLGSLLFNSTATPATLTNIIALVNGTDL